MHDVVLTGPPTLRRPVEPHKAAQLASLHIVERCRGPELKVPVRHHHVRTNTVKALHERTDRQRSDVVHGSGLVPQTTSAVLRDPEQAQVADVQRCVGHGPPRSVGRLHAARNAEREALRRAPRRAHVRLSVPRRHHERRRDREVVRDADIDDRLGTGNNPVLTDSILRTDQDEGLSGDGKGGDEQEQEHVDLAVELFCPNPLQKFRSFIEQPRLPKIHASV